MDAKWNGEPTNPEVDGWHWLKWKVGKHEPHPYHWVAGTEAEWETDGGYDIADMAEHFDYVGPVAPPSIVPDQRDAELAALRARVGELEGALDEAANALDDIAEATWDKRHPEECKSACAYASDMAGGARDAVRALAAGQGG